ncbi:MAG: site-specific integrase [Candidatus Sedimenticola endophacoides]
MAGARKPKGQSETRRTLYGDVIPKLGKMPANAITRKAVVDMIMAIVQRGANVQAGNVLREFSAAYEFAIGLGYFSDEFANPAILAKASLRQAKVKLTHQRGKRVLSDTELATLLKWLPGADYTATQKNVLRFTLWTGCRTGEVCNADWQDIDLEKQTFHIRESKTGTERYVQLPRQAVEFLTALRMTTGDYLFPSQKTKLPIQQKQLTEQAWRMRQADTMIKIPTWTPHDLRRSVRTGLSRLQCPNEVAEAALGHSRKGIEGTYDLHRYEAECRQWLQKWADHLDSLIGTG